MSTALLTSHTWILGQKELRVPPGEKPTFSPHRTLSLGGARRARASLSEEPRTAKRGRNHKRDPMIQPDTAVENLSSQIPNIDRDAAAMSYYIVERLGNNYKAAIDLANEYRDYYMLNMNNEQNLRYLPQRAVRALYEKVVLEQEPTWEHYSGDVENLLEEMENDIEQQLSQIPDSEELFNRQQLEESKQEF